MNKAKAKQRIEKLKQLINDYRYHYHVLNQSIMSEEAADSLKHELTLLEEKYPDLITPDSPTQRVVSAISSGFQQVRHSSRMLSLNDVFNEQEIRAWQDRIGKLLPQTNISQYFIDIKMDGLACALIYQDGHLEQAITRGDGFVGEDVTNNIRTIESIPLRLRQTKDAKLFSIGRSEIRGEIVMYKQDFIKLNEERAKANLPLFANPRNTAAGTIRQLDPKLVASRPLHFRAYDLLRDNSGEVPTNDYAYRVLHDLGFLVNYMAKEVSNLKDILEFIDLWQDNRHELPFNTDGLVIKLNNREQFNQLGVVGKAPRGAIAYKYAAEQATTKLQDIFISIGRTGAATPVAILEPVIIAGSRVQMATLHNQNEIEKKDIRIGDTVIVHKAGDIIPEIVEPLISLRDGSEKKFKMYSLCPVCHSKLVKKDSDEVVWRCPNKNCPSRTWKAIEHFASKQALDIEGLGEKNVIALIEAKLINDPADLFNIKQADLLKLDRFATVSAKKLITNIKAKKTPQLSRFIYGLGIRHIGAQTADDLARRFGSLSKLEQVTFEQLNQVEGIGNIVAESIIEWFANQDNLKLLDKFNNFGVKPIQSQSPKKTLLNLSFVITGSLTTMTREAVADKIRSLGGIFQSSVSKDTDYLVVGNNVGHNKLEKAKQLGVKQISEQELFNLLNTEG
jgi:DNA ligase (NAD+)